MGEKELKLSPRLQCIAELVRSGARLADVGTDHAYLPVWLLQNGKITRAVASDVVEGPLSRARQTAEEYGQSERLEFRLCDGLDGYDAGECDVVVIAGMGGETMIGILGAAPWLRQEGVTLLLQPMTRAELLRPWLAENGYRIECERLVRDRGTIYAVLEVTAGLDAPYTSPEAWCGRNSKGETLYGEYVSDRIRKLEEAAAGLRRAKQIDEALLSSVEADAAALRREREEWTHANRSGDRKQAL